MASSSGKRTSSSGRTRKSTTSSRNRQARRSAQDSELFHEIGLIVLFVAMLILFCCNFGIIGPVGNAISGVLFGIFGFTAYIAPVVIFLAVAFWLISSLFVWDIQVTGNYQVTDDVFYSFLEQEGIHTGMRRSELNIGELEKQIRRKFSQVTWTSGRLDGTRLVIEVKENDMSVPEVVQDAAGAGKDLVAECNGVITDMIVRCGVPKVSIGSEVAKGDILVEGRIPIYAEDGTVREYRPVTPDADIVLEHTGTFQAYLPADYIRKKYTGRQKTFYFIHFGDREWKPEKKMDFLQYDSVLETCPVKALEYLQIPCMVGRITYREYQKTEYYYTVSEAETVLQKKIMDFLETLDEKGVQIISKDVKIETKRAGWTAHGELLLREAAVSLVDSRAEDTGAEDLDRNED